MMELQRQNEMMTRELAAVKKELAQQQDQHTTAQAAILAANDSINWTA